MSIIRAIEVPTNLQAGSTRMELLRGDGSNTLHVLAGPNRSGKSFVLQNLERVLRDFRPGHNGGDKTLRLNGVSAEFSMRQTGQVAAYLIADIDHLIKKASSIPLSLERRRQRGNPELLARESINRCFHRNLSFMLPNQDLTFEEWADSETLRNQVFKSLAASKIHRGDPDEPLCKSFEEATGGSLYFGYTPKYQRVDLFVRFPGQNAQFIFRNWSYGHRALFTLLLYVFYRQARVLLVDEIENHLHPQFISHFFKEARRSIEQTVVTSHHPHAVFSRFADSVHYMEVLHDSPEAMPAIAERMDEKSSFRNAPKRRVVPLNSEFAKISNVYRLFESYDRNLLHLSRSGALSMSDSLISSVKRVFEDDVKDVGTGPLPDVQSDQLAESLIERLRKAVDVRVLDLGAGRGRTFLEVGKVIPKNAGLEWWFWEPDEVLRRELEVINREWKNTRVLSAERFSECSDCFDIVVVSNVLHECNPVEAARVLFQCRNLVTQEGDLFVFELFPLLHSEKFAVAYTRENMTDLMRTIGWVASSGAVSIRGGGASAYFVHCRKGSQVYSCEDIEREIRGVWRGILRRRCADYRGKLTVVNAQDLLSALGDLTTIASICCDGEGEWPDRGAP